MIELQPRPRSTIGDEMDGPGLAVLVVDDRKLTRVGLRVLLDQDPRVNIIGEAFTHGEAILLQRSRHPDVVLIDALAHSIDPQYLCRRLTRENGVGPACVLALVDDMDEDAWGILRSGARGVLLKRSGPDELVAALALVAAGYMVFTPTGSCPGALGPQSGDGERGSLTAREVDVLRLVGHGYSNAEISRLLRIQLSTVKSHVRNVLEKLSLQNRVQAALYAHRAGFLEIEGVAAPNSIYS
jgi:DNA-binding NarL/FixJ family response regulator